MVTRTRLTRTVHCLSGIQIPSVIGRDGCVGCPLDRFARVDGSSGCFLNLVSHDTTDGGQTGEVKKENSACPTLYLGGHGLEFLRSDRLSRLLRS